MLSSDYLLTTVPSYQAVKHRRSCPELELEMITTLMDIVVEKSKYCTFKDIVELSGSLLLAPTEPLFKVAGYQVVVAVQTESESLPTTTMNIQHPYFHPCMHAIGKQRPETRKGKESVNLFGLF